MTGAMVDLAGLASEVEWTDSESAAAARDAIGITASRGRLDELREWLAGTTFRYPPAPLRRATCLLVGAPEDPVREVAGQLDVAVRALPVDDGDRVADVLESAAAVVDGLIDEGCELLVVAAPPSTGAALVVSVLTGREPVAVLPRGAAAVDTAAWIAAAEQLRDRRRSAAELHDRPDELLAAAADPELAAAAGAVLRAVSRRTPVVLDGAGAAAAALLCHEVAPRASRWWRFADRSPDSVHTVVVDELSAEPLLDLGTTAGDGLAGVLTVALLRAAAA